jgi:hypothetical protein
MIGLMLDFRVQIMHVHSLFVVHILNDGGFIFFCASRVARKRGKTRESHSRESVESGSRKSQRGMIWVLSSFSSVCVVDYHANQHCFGL